MIQQSAGVAECLMAFAVSSSAVAPRRLVLWFRNDLRLRDNPLVHEAVKRVKSKEFDDVRF